MSSPYLASSTYVGQYESIPSSPLSTHKAAISKAKQEHSERNVFILYIGQADPSGHSWCPDCNDIKSLLSTLPDNSYLLECQVTREEWKNSPGSNHPLRSQRFAAVSGVPCLVKMGFSRPVATLIEDQIQDSILFTALIEA